MDDLELERLYGRLEKPIYNVVYRWLWNADDAHDVVQEAFVRLWDARARVDAATGEPFVYRIALNLAASRLRRRKRWAWVPLEAVRALLAEAHPEDEAVGRQEHERVRMAVQRLPDELRNVVLLCELTDMTYEQIGRVLAIPPGTVGSRRHRALETLRREIETGVTTREIPGRRPV
jgi:RNA polymerase sigma-70 factor (ECF subfamily)